MAEELKIENNLTFMIEHIDAVLRSLRKSYDWTLANVAERTGLSISYLSDLENGRTVPSLGTLKTIVECYGAVLNFQIVHIADIASLESNRYEIEAIIAAKRKDYLSLSRSLLKLLGEE